MKKAKYIKNKKRKVVEKKAKRKINIISKVSKISLFVFIISIIFVYNFTSVKSALRGAISFGNVKIEKTYSYEFNSNLDYKSATVIESGLDYTLIKDDNSLNYYDKNMQLKWKKEINASDVIIKSSGDLIVVANRLIGDIYTINKKGEIIGKQLTMGKIKDIVLTSSENFLVYFEDDGIVRILDKATKVVSEILIPGYNVTDFDISPKDDVVAISLYKVENEAVFSSIMTYSLDGELTGIMNKEDQIIYDLEIVNNSITVVTDKGISKYSFANEILFDDYLFERELSSFSIDESGNVVANLIIESKDLADTRSDNVLVVVDKSGKEALVIDLENTIQKIAKFGTEICYFADDKLYVLDEKGAVLGIQLIKENPIKISWVDENRISVLYNDSYDLFTLR